MEVCMHALLYLYMHTCDCMYVRIMYVCTYTYVCMYHAEQVMTQ